MILKVRYIYGNGILLKADDQFTLSVYFRFQIAL